MKSHTIGNDNHIWRSGIFRLRNPFTRLPILAVSCLVLLFTACPDNNNPPPIADCDPGYHPCGTDSTECCLDTTSHNFIFSIDTIGDYGSYLNDVAIIDENNIWVVGYIKDGDSTYNAARWDGNEWEFILISPAGLTNPISCIFAFNENNIWFGKVGLPVHWDGQNYFKYTPANSSHPGQPSIDAIWGSNSNDLYFVGGNGTIVHYDGSGFEKMESLPGQGGTDIDFKDIWGVVDEKTGKINIWICGDDNDPDRSIVLTLDDGEWKTVYERYPYGGGNSIDDEIYFTPKTFTLWATADSQLLWVAGGWGVYTLNDKYDPTEYTYIDIENEVGYFSFPWKIRGNRENDIFVAGENMALFHFNGSSWFWYNTFYAPHTRLISLAIHSNIVVAVGTDYSSFLTKAFVIRGYR